MSALRGEKAVQQTGAETVHKLCDRVRHSTLLEDRRAAVMGLKGLARDWKLEVGTKGMSVLVNVLQNDRADVEIIKAVTETLNILCSPDALNDHTRKAEDDAEDLGKMFTEIYTKDPANVTILLDVLEEADFYVRFYTVQLLSTLLEHGATRLQDCILTSPLGISRLIDLLDDRREIIRNEGLLLLIALTQNNADIQKIIAFENAFERLLAIIMDEGATDGGIIVQDCLTLTHNLLKYNVSNQNLFRETSCINRIPSLLTNRMPGPDQSGTIDTSLTDESSVWSDQKIINTVLVLELIRIIAGPKNPSAQANQTTICHAKIIPMLIDLVSSSHVPSEVKAQALLSLGDAIRGHKANQDMVTKSAISLEFKTSSANVPPVPCVLFLIRLALDQNQFAERAASAYAVQSYLYHNPDAQLGLISTILAPPTDNPNERRSDTPHSAGSLLISAILDWDTSRKDPFRAWFAATIVAHAISDNDTCKRRALATKLDEDEDAIPLLHKCMYALLHACRAGADVRVVIAMFSLLCVWVNGCPKAVTELLSEGSNVQFLVEQVNQSSGVNPLVQGAAAFLLGLVIEYNDDSEPTFTRSGLQSLVASRVGYDVYASRLERLRESKELNSACQHILKPEMPVDANGLPQVFFDLLFVDIFKSSYDAVVTGISVTDSKRRAPQTDDATIQSYRDTITSQAQELANLRSQLDTLQVTLSDERAKHADQMKALQQTVDELRMEMSQERTKYSELAEEQEDLLVCLADQDAQMKVLRNKLRSYGEVLSDEDDDAQEDHPETTISSSQEPNARLDEDFL
ncbi:Vesicle-mediated ER to Golgi transport protein [Gaertneriomyces sp. JEL0708]|nr:Vesicle-mediated ER to Golgi transport protein [Gaertneriomyces sp. JEL0708]